MYNMQGTTTGNYVRQDGRTWNQQYHENRQRVYEARQRLEFNRRSATTPASFNNPYMWSFDYA